jgi:glycyl-tRNA synthetase
MEPSPSEKKVTLETLISLCKQRGFIYQGSDIYGGLAGTWDFGPLGVELKNNIKASWWKTFVHQRNDVFGLDAAILMSGKVWEASGHVHEFHDPLVEDSVTKKRYRTDHLLEDHGISADGLTISEMDSIIRDKKLKSPDGNELGEVKQFNMMFSTRIGAAEDSSAISYLRPETAQGIFVNFKNINDSFHPKMPFGIAQIGKAFRNEITPRDFIFRVRELEQMEIEYFIDPRKPWEPIFDQLLEQMKAWLNSIGVDMSLIRMYEHPEAGRSHYSKKTVDLEFEFPFGQKELTGLAYRTDFDLQTHQKNSKVSLEYYDQETNTRFIPHVIEPSFGLDRAILAVLVSAYREQVVLNEAGQEEKRVYLALHPSIAPLKVAVLPLMKKDGLAEKGREIWNILSAHMSTTYDTAGSIGKRYRRQDEIGTPWCITVDYQTLEDETVTIRDRDTLQQDRVSTDSLVEYFKQKLSLL